MSGESLIAAIDSLTEDVTNALAAGEDVSERVTQNAGNLCFYPVKHVSERLGRRSPKTNDNIDMS